MDPTDISVSDAPSTQSRREALKKFGRYAAAAPVAMVLLMPDEGHADRRRGREVGGRHY